MSALWGNLPPELLRLKQWCLAGNDGAPYSVDASGKPYHASVTDNATWLPYNVAVTWALHHGMGIGFVLTPDDGYACIDLDVVSTRSQERKGQAHDPSKHTSQDQFNRYWKLIQTFDSYTERSRSGEGVHVWARGVVGDGKRRDGVELYSQFRFIICTGDTLDHPPKPIAQRQEWLDILRQELEGPVNQLETLIEIPPREPDETIWVRAATAVNKENFIELCNGQWQGKFPSQSEADLALLSMLCFYSPSNEQVKRMFRTSALGQRDKAQKDDKYLNRTLLVIRSRMVHEDRIMTSNMMHNIQEVASKLLATAPNADAKDLVQAIQHNHQQDNSANRNVPEPPPQEVALATMRNMPDLPGDGSLPWPPGFAGSIAQFIYRSAARPVKEIAIVGMLGVLAGMCGRAYEFSHTGLNIYIILVAQSGVGKEGMHTGVARLINSLIPTCPQANQFVDFTNYASGSALSKQMVSNPCFLNVCGEWGKRLKKFAASEDKDEGGPANLQTVMTDLYQKSGPSSIVGGIGYSDQEKNTMAVEGVAYSMIGETTPGTFFETLTRAMMADGFLSRFTIVQYTGDRPPLNLNQSVKPDDAVIKNLSNLANHSHSMNSRGQRSTVGIEADAKALMDAWEKQCDENVNGTKEEARRQMWSRASLKTMRISALLAIADHYSHPVIQKQHFEWAHMLICADIKIMSARIEEGDVGIDDHTRTQKILSLCYKYVSGNVPASLKIKPEMVRARVVPHRYLSQLTSALPAFTKHKLGANAALEGAIRLAINNGNLYEVSKDRAWSDFQYNGKCYSVVNLD